jgi:hypothetical protein
MINAYEIIVILHLVVIFSVYCILGLFISIIINRTIGKIDLNKYKTRNSFVIFCEILFELVVTGICAYYLRYVIIKLSSFLSIYSNVGELEIVSGVIITAYIMITIQTNLKQKINFLYERYFHESLI